MALSIVSALAVTYRWFPAHPDGTRGNHRSGDMCSSLGHLVICVVANFVLLKENIKFVYSYNSYMLRHSGTIPSDAPPPQKEDLGGGGNICQYLT